MFYTAPALALLLLTGPVEPQIERYELARRLTAFEAAWEKSDAAGRKRSAWDVGRVMELVGYGHLGEAGRALDRAAFALHTEAGPSTSRQWAWCLAAIPAMRVVDGSAKELVVTVRPFYPVK